MGIHIYEERAKVYGHNVKRLCIEGYERLATVEETGEIAIFSGQPYASMFLTVNKVQPSDKLKVNDGFDYYSEISKMVWGNVKDKERTQIDERR